MSMVLRIFTGCVLVGCSSEPTVSKPAPNVLVVVLDTVRPDKLSTYGYSHPTSPQLDEVAAAGVTFEDVTAPSPWTWPSHASLFTGKGPWEHGAHASRSSRGIGLQEGHWGLLPMRTDLPTLAERFTESGYRTVSLASNRFLDPSLGLTRGFEIAETMHDHVLGERARAVMDKQDDRPLFMFINILLAHAPWEVYPAPWSKRHMSRLQTKDKAPEWMKGYRMNTTPGIDFYKTAPGTKEAGYRRLMSGELVIPSEDMGMIEDLYTGGITAADYLLHQVLERWTGLYPDGIVVVTSDHGEYLGEHGLWDHGKTVYSQVVQVPLVMAAPGRLPAQKRISTPVQLHDLYDTLLDIAGISEDTPYSLIPIVDGASRPGPILSKAYASRAWSEGFGGRFAHDWTLYRDQQWALVSNSEGKRELFDLVKDPGMTTDVADSEPQRVLSMSAQADQSFPESAPQGTELQMAADMIQELKALGYLED